MKESVPHDHRHQSHGPVVQRLKRAEGHLRTVTRMIEDGRDCVEIAQQLHAVEKAISVAKRVLIHDHIDHCMDALADAPSEGERAALDAFKEITKYL